MKKMSAKDAATARKRFKESGEAYRQTKLDLVRAAHESESSNRFPEYLCPDMNDDAWFHRKSAASELIEKRGEFSSHVSMLALVDSDWETKEAVASWLRRELKVLRVAEGKSGGAPVRRNVALSRTVISDVAVELLECIGGEALVCLFQELLDIDRHRRSRAESFVQLDRAAEMEAQLNLQGRHTRVRELAGHMSVSPSSVTRWRKNSAYRGRVDFHKRVWGNFMRDEYFDQIKSKVPTLSEPECFRRAFALYASSIPARRGRSTQANTRGPIAAPHAAKPRRNSSSK
ncbi:hypothetical protein [Bradyrhizobium uaiense]|uniref:Uncharacterized protein n=1 Tax=Bradyrhizobium uaiense TaxID=2594946 RepID=A0A6P1BHA6_9BRAD|nr:hypothetical protein [Bradyrhizobium uaiense]NEU97020.1 hypothetical protein [Bradyrhizobium uaiense]